MDSLLRFLFSAFSLLSIGNAVAQTPHTLQHGFSGAENWAKVFDDPDRDRWQKPHEVIMALKLAPDAKIADIGAGTGYFAARLAHMTPADVSTRWIWSPTWTGIWGIEPNATG